MRSKRASPPCLPFSCLSCSCAGRKPLVSSSNGEEAKGVAHEEGIGARRKENAASADNNREQEQEVVWIDSEDSDSDVFEDALENAFELDPKAAAQGESFDGFCESAAIPALEECLALHSEGLLARAHNLMTRALEDVDRTSLSVFWQTKVNQLEKAFGQCRESLKQVLKRQAKCRTETSRDEDGDEDGDGDMERDENRFEGYTLVSKSNPKIWYRHVKGTPIHSIKYEAEYDFSADKVYAMGWEFNYIDTWNPFAIEPAILQKDGDHAMVLYCAIWLPWPFHPREVFVQIRSSDHLDEHGCYLVTIHDVEYENKLAESLRPAVVEESSAGEGKGKRVGAKAKGGKKRDRERCSILEGSCAAVWPMRADWKDPNGSTATKKSSNNNHSSSSRTRVVISCHTDPLVFSPPVWLVNFVLKLMAPTIHKSLLKALQKAYSEKSKTPFREIVRQRALYSKMRRRFGCFV